MQTGYFANPETGRSSKVHVVDGNHKPICGAQIGEGMEYQWCSRRIVIRYVDCRHCRNIYVKNLENTTKSPLRGLRKLNDDHGYGRR
jgi:hypothetical protein